MSKLQSRVQSVVDTINVSATEPQEVSTTFGKWNVQILQEMNCTYAYQNVLFYETKKGGDIAVLVLYPYGFAR